MQSKSTPKVYRQPIYDMEDTAGQANALHNDGFALIPGVLNSEQCSWARNAIDDMHAFHWDVEGIVDHYKCVFNRDPGWLRFLDWPGIIDTMEAVLGSDCHVIGQSAWRCHPGFRGVGLHADHTMFDMSQLAPPPNWRIPMFICTVHYYLTDVDEELCPTYVIPNSFKSGRCPMANEQSWQGRFAEPVTCKAGDVLIFRSDLWHRGSDNITADRIRYLLQVHYSIRMITQKFSPYMTWKFADFIFDLCTARQLRLLGNHPRGNYD